MKAALIVAALVLVYAIMRGVSDESMWVLPSLLPGLGGKGRPAMYEWAAVALCVIALWGVGRVLGGKD